MWILGVGKVAITIMLLFFFFGMVSCLVDDRARKSDRICYFLGIATFILSIFYIWI